MPAHRTEIRYPSRPSRPSRPAGPSPLRPRAPGLAIALASVFAVALLAGCTGGTGGGDANRAPHAELKVDDDNGWTGDDFTFDGKGSSDDGKIDSWRFDFGDGTPPMTVSDENQARVTHKYARGGQFTVTLTVTDDGKDSTGSLSDDDSVNVVVNERVRVATMSINAIGGANTTGSQPFKVYDKANRFQLNLTLTSALPSGSSEFEVRVTDPEGDTIAEKSVTVSPGSPQEVTLDGLLTKQGDHKVEVEATSGGGTADGELRVIYGEDLPG